jgi:Fic family protein
MDNWNPESMKDLLNANGLLTAGLIDESGVFRSRGVGIYKGKELIHMAPPADRVHGLMTDLMTWLASTSEHPIVASGIFHYEFEFIHPFSDGNGRLGRLWQTLILSKWKPLWAYLPVEIIVREQQQQYYDLLGKADAAGDATLFVEFIVQILKQTLAKAIALETGMGMTHQATQHVTHHVRLLLEKTSGEIARLELMRAVGLKDRVNFRMNYLEPALHGGWLEMTQPDSPKSPTQRYRLTAKGRNYLQASKDKA